MTKQNMLDTDDSTGLLGHFIGTVKTSWWSTPMAETNGEQSASWAQQTRLYWDVSIDDALQEDYGGTIPESLTLSFTCGKGWLADVSGREVRHEDDPSDEDVEAGKAKAKLFRTDSNYGRFVALIVGKVDDWGNTDPMDSGGDIELDLGAVGEFLTENRTPDPRDATVWVGTQWEFRGMGKPWKNQQGEMQEARMKALPCRFLGATDTDVTPTNTATKNDDNTHITEWAKCGADPSTVATLNALRGAASSHTEFLKNAALLPSVKDNEELLKVIEATTDGPWS